MWEIFLLIWLLQKFFSIFNDYYVAVIYRENIAFIAFWRYKIHKEKIKVEVFWNNKKRDWYTSKKKGVRRWMKGVVTLFLLFYFFYISLLLRFNEFTHCLNIKKKCLTPCLFSIHLISFPVQLLFVPLKFAVAESFKKIMTINA